MNKYTVLFQQAAKEDVNAIVEWYEFESTALSVRFEQDLETCINRITSYPENYPFHIGLQPIRKLRLYKFPYYVFYLLKDFEIAVIGIIHTSRSDKFINKRLT